MRYLRYFALMAGSFALAGVMATSASAQVRVGVGVGVGPAIVDDGPAPICAYGYYDYYPYACAPYGYWGPDYFVNGVFIGVGPWARGYWGFDRFGHRTWFDRGFDRDRGFRGFDRGDRGFRGNDRGFRGGDRGFRGNDRGFHGNDRGFRGNEGRSFNGGGFRGGNMGHGGQGFRGNGGSHGGGGSRGSGGGHGGHGH